MESLLAVNCWFFYVNTHYRKCDVLIMNSYKDGETDENIKPVPETVIIVITISTLPIHPITLLQVMSTYNSSFYKRQKGQSVLSCISSPAYLSGGDRDLVQAGVFAAEHGEGRGCRRHRKAFVHCLLPRSQLEFHLFSHRNEMALIVGSDVL